MSIQNLSIVINTFFNKTIQEVVVVSEKNNLKTFSPKNPILVGGNACRVVVAILLIYIKQMEAL